MTLHKIILYKGSSSAKQMIIAPFIVLFTTEQKVREHESSDEQLGKKINAISIVLII